MIDKRFNKNEFERLGRNSNEAKRRIAELNAEIATQMHKAVEKEFRNIANTLRELGHALEEDEVEIIVPDMRGYTFKDRGSKPEVRRLTHALRIHFDTLVCGGYPHYGESNNNDI